VRNEKPNDCKSGGGACTLAAMVCLSDLCGHTERIRLTHHVLIEVPQELVRVILRADAIGNIALEVSTLSRTEGQAG
jgi:hypothetical protein